MNLRALQTFLAIHDSQSFADAARRLGLTQSAVSMQIKSLEEDLGVKLFDRSVRPPSMTPAAMAIANSVREVIALVESIGETVKNSETFSGRLGLGVIPTATISLLPDCLSLVNRRYPKIQITVESGLSAILLERVRSGILDAAVITQPPEVHPDVRCETLIRERLALISAVDLNVPVSLANLQNYAFIRFVRRIGVGQVIDRFLASKGLHPAEYMELDSVEGILAMVERGLGVAIVPERAVGEAHRQRIVVSPIDDLEAVRNVSLVFRGRAINLPLLEVVLASFQSAAKGVR